MPPKHFVSVSAVILNHKNEILLIKGLKRGWELPGGLLEYGEKITEALVREVYEETGVEICNAAYRGLYHNLKDDTINLLFIANYNGGILTTSDESLEVGFFSFNVARQIVTWSNFCERIENVICKDTTFLVEF